MKVFKHNKTGKLYELVQEHLLFKDRCHSKPFAIAESFDEWRTKLKWRKDDSLVLYKALYDNPDGPYFVRHAEDFYKNFTEFKYDNMTKAAEWELECRMPLSDWYEQRDMGLFTNDDGCGYYGTEDEVSKIEVFSQLTAPVGMNYVYWYNK